MKISREELVNYYWSIVDSCDRDKPIKYTYYEEGDELCLFHYDSWKKLLILDEYSNDKSTTTLTIPPQFDVLNMHIGDNMSFSTVDLSNIKYVTDKCRLEHIKRLKKIIGLNLIHTCRINSDCTDLTEPGFCMLYSKLADRDFVLDCLCKRKSLELVVDMTKIQFFAGWEFCQNHDFPTEYDKLKFTIVNGSTIQAHTLREDTIGYNSIVHG